MADERTLADALTSLQHRLNKGDNLEYEERVVMLQAAQRLRELDGERIEVFVRSGELAFFKSMKEEARTRNMLVSTFPVCDDDAILILHEPQEQSDG